VTTKKQLEERIAALEAEVALLRSRPVTPPQWQPVGPAWPPQWWVHCGTGQVSAPLGAQYTINANDSAIVRDLKRRQQFSAAFASGL